MKRFITIALSAAGLVILVVAVYVATTHYLANTASKSNVVSCTHTGVEHFVFIQNNVLDRTVIHGALCDTLTIVNEDNRLRLMAFGVHDHHQAYDGITEKVLSQGQSLTVVLDRPGTFLFHDHLEDEVHGTFIVASD